MAPRIERIFIAPCGCYTRRTTESFMGETFSWLQPIFCNTHK